MTGQAAGPDPLIGRVLGERYQIETLLGEGGVGRVYRARHAALGRSVALKVLLTEHESSDMLRERFRREADALAALSHPHIVSVTDFDVDGEMLFLVMELLEGSSLEEVLRAGPIEPARALSIVRQVLLALGYAHARNVVHRDLKPHNVFVRRLDDGTDHVTVLDFGLARFLGAAREGPQLTRAGMIVGTPAYMAPEQASGDVDAIDARTDVYAAGLLLYEVLAGRRPFPGKDPGEVLRAHLLLDPPPLSVVDPGLIVPDALQKVLSCALAKIRPNRFADATEMLAALDAFDWDTVRREGARPSLDASDVESMVSAATMAAPQTAGAAVAGGARVAAPNVTAPNAAAPSVAASSVEAAPRRSARAPLLVAVGLGLGLLMLVGVGGLVLWFVQTPDVEPAPRAQPAPSAPIAPAPAPTPAPPATDAARDPFDEPLPDPLRAMNARVAAGRALSRSQVRAVRAWARDNDDDVRAHLMLAHSYTNERSLSWAFPAYEAAMERDRSARGYPYMLPDLLEMVRSNALSRQASDAVVSWYGAEALPAVLAALQQRLRADEQRRLEDLTRRLSAG